MSFRARAWIGTSFKIKHIEDDEEKINQLSFQLERCPTTEKEHLQFCIQFKHPKTRSAVQKYINDDTAHLQQCHNLQKGLQYCIKEETRVGEPFARYNATSLSQAPNDFRLLTTEELWKNHPTWMLRNHAGVDKWRTTQIHRMAARTKPSAIILWGPPGTGKSFSARLWLGETYYIKPPGQFWIGYQGEPAVLFDDYYSSEKYDDLLRWISENPMHIPIKGSHRPLQAIKFAFTSNLNPINWHSRIEDKAALWRRIDKIYHCFNDAFYIHEM